MPTIISHAVFASALGKVYGTTAKHMSPRFWVLTAVCAMLPDIDVVGFTLGVPYSSIWGHRGITHSIFFALVIGFVVGLLTFASEQRNRFALVVYFFLVTLSHPLLDALTNGGRGVALLAPFSATRHFSPWRPIEVSPLGIGFFSERGLQVIVSEIIWVWLPALFIFLAVIFYKRITTHKPAL